VKDQPQAGFLSGDGANWQIDNIVADANGVGVALSATVGKLKLGTVTITNSTSGATGGLNLGSLALGADIEIQSLVTSGNAGGALHHALLYGNCHILKSSMAEATKVFSDSGGYSDGKLVMQNFNLTANDHRIYGRGGGSTTGLYQIFSETSVRHTASGIAWKLSPLSTVYVIAAAPIVMPIAKVAVNASALVTVKLWMRRTNTGLTGTLRCRGGQIGGVPSDVTDSIGAAIDTWEEQTITFTPNEAGVVDIDVLCYGGTTFSLYIDDMTITQA
jgi:hypothetical protein